ncbi:fibronectin type III domain-containing protein [Geobacter sp. FeAm09]|nr:fibronectin type III domain-containing protein [Geobacter sp. FeAm09]
MGTAATAGYGRATVSFTPPAADGGATITAYTVTSSPGSITATGTASPITVTGLADGTAYTFTVAATNSAGTGTASGASNSVTTPSRSAPTAVTGAAAAVTASGATLNGTVADNGYDTTVTFDYGTTTGYGTTTAATTGATVGTGAGSTPAVVALTGLNCNATYHFRVKGTNSAGTTNGSDATFTTAACTSTPTFAIADALLALKAAVGTVTPTASQLLHLDVAPLVGGVSVGDGKINVEDVLVILRRTIGLL